MNVVVVRGTLSRQPEERMLKSGDRLVGFDLTVREEDRPTVTVPVVWPDPPATAARRLTEGADVLVTGSVRRRFFRAGGVTASRTEIVADRVLAARGRASAAALVDVGARLRAV